MARLLSASPKSPALPYYSPGLSPQLQQWSNNGHTTRRRGLIICLLIACGYYASKFSDTVFSVNTRPQDEWSPLREFLPFRSFTASTRAGSLDVRLWQQGDVPLAFTPLWNPPPSEEALCDVCDCLSDPSLPQLPSSQRFAAPLTDPDQLAAFMHSTLLNTFCAGVYMQPNYTESINHPLRLPYSTSALVHRARDHPEQVFSWELRGLRLGVPTTYVFTKTSMLARTASKRPRYLDRTAIAIRKNRDDARERGFYNDGTPFDGRQLIWVIVEDSPHIDPEVAALLAPSGIPYIYTSFGPTTHYGNAQHNAAYTLIHALSNPANGALGHGPVVSVDDDGEVLPELFDIIWGVKRIGCWPMGNLGPTGWEGPVSKDGKIVEWPAWQEWRRFPLDNGAFAINSSLLGTTLPGPRFWPTDIEGGESEFIGSIIDSRDDIELLCENCHVAWHNQLNL